MRRFRGRHEVALGSSGTINAIERIVVGMGWSDEGITETALRRLEEYLIAEDGLDKKKVPFDVSAERLQVLPGGVAILRAVFRTLQVDWMRAVHLRASGRRIAGFMGSEAESGCSCGDHRGPARAV